LTRFTLYPRFASAPALASILALALAAPVAHAQQDDGTGGQAPGEDPEMTDGERAADAEGSEPAETHDAPSVLQEAVLEELAAIGIDSLTIDKLSSGQLAGILLTLTSTDRQDKEEAVTTIAANADYEPQDVDAETVADNESLRNTVEEALVRAGWSADVSQLTHAQVAALYLELAGQGELDEQRIQDVVSE